jgi:hypothetical protein
MLLPGFPHNFALDPDQPERTILIRIRGSGGRQLSGNELSSDDLASLRQDLPGAERFTEEWKSIPMDGLRAITDDPDGVTRVHYALPLSTEPEAVLIWLNGPESRDSEVRAYLKALIGSLEGTPALAQPKDRFVLKNKHLVLAAIAISAVVFLGWRAWRRKRIPLVRKVV